MLPANAGVMRPIRVIIPDKSLLAAEFPAPSGGYAETILCMIDVMISAFAQVAPGKVVANAYGTINALSIAGRRGDGRRWVMFSFYGGGPAALNRFTCQTDTGRAEPPMVSRMVGIPLKRGQTVRLETPAAAALARLPRVTPPAWPGMCGWAM